MEKELQNAIKTLKEGRLLLYPTDTVWGIGCDATNEAAVQKVFKLKQRETTKALICLVSDYAMLGQYIHPFPEHLKTILANQKKPTTVIYQNSTGLANNLLAADGSIGIRICQADFCQALIKRFGKPIVSTSANLSGCPTPTSFEEIGEEIIKGVDYIVNLQPDKKIADPSSIIKIGSDHEIIILRE